MKIRKASLAEWFLQYQLQKVYFKYCHNPFHLEVDVSHLVRAAESKGLRFSPTAAVVKAVGDLVLKHPKLNRIMFHSFWGLRIVELEEIRINLPVKIHNHGDPVLSAMVISSPQNKSVPEIHQEIRKFAQGDLSDKPIGRFVHSRSNHWFNRLFLKTLYSLVLGLPQIYLKKGGGALSVSSLMKRDTREMKLLGPAIGFTPLTFTVCGLKKNRDNSHTLLLGIDFNHSILEGDEFSEACASFSQILSSSETRSYYP